MSLAAEYTKTLVYRTPILRRLMVPRYDYKVCPAQLARMIELISATRETGGAVVEIGVARGQTSMFLLEHMRDTRDPRRVQLFDTFSGFTDHSISIEVSSRGKQPADFQRFRYISEALLRRDLCAAGYDAFDTIKGDASRFDWPSLGPIAAVLLDIDVYQPTRDILRAIYPKMVEGGGIVVDDCIDDTPDDGACAAYREFTEERGLPLIKVGSKGGLILAGG